MDTDRRRYPRLKAPVLCRPGGLFMRLFTSRQERQPNDISLGGMRIFSDDPVKIGALLDLELFLPSGANITCKGTVAWIEKLPEGSPAVYDVGVRFTDFKDTDRERLASVLTTEG